MAAAEAEAVAAAEVVALAAASLAAHGHALPALKKSIKNHN